MSRRIRAVSALLISLSMFLTPMAALAAAPAPELTARATVVMDQATGQVLASKNLDEKSQPASLTKVMTLLLTYEAIASGKVKATDLVPVSNRAWKTEGSKMFLRVGSKVPLEEMIKGMAVVSGNDACVAVAEFLGGSQEDFVSMMNKKAAELGLSNTHFVDPHGISDNNQISARDAANLARVYIRDYPQALAIHSMREYTYTPEGGKPIRQDNRNRLLGQYDGVDGLKTGHTEKAGYNLIATAERGGTRFIAVIMGVQAKTEAQGETLRAQQLAKVLDWAFAGYSTSTVLSTQEKLSVTRVYKGEKDEVSLGAQKDVKYTLEKGTESAVEKKVTVDPRVVAPIKKGQVLGSVSLVYRGQEIQKLPLVAMEDVAQGGFFKRIIDSIRLQFKRD
jgi:serine-type D-Ala-D-Ala carboxypeptidase (penicillin-binding protein 5/6)